MNKYIVLFRINGLSSFNAFPPFAIDIESTSAEVAEHRFAEEHPACEVVWVYEGSDFDDAYDHYWSAIFNSTGDAPKEYLDFDARR